MTVYDDEPANEPRDPNVLRLADDYRTALNGSRLDPDDAERIEQARGRIRAERDRFGPITG